MFGLYVEVQMDRRERKAYNNIRFAANDLLGGLENTLLDNPKDSNEYQNAKALLEDHDELVEMLYMNATTAIYDVGYVGFSSSHQALIRDIRFLGKEKLMQMCEERIVLEGY